MHFRISYIGKSLCSDHCITVSPKHIKYFLFVDCNNFEYIPITQKSNENHHLYYDAPIFDTGDSFITKMV
jgi:hypothetical protein